MTATRSGSNLKVGLAQCKLRQIRDDSSQLFYRQSYEGTTINAVGGMMCWMALMYQPGGHLSEAEIILPTSSAACGT